MSEDPADNGCDQSLRGKFEDFDLTPSARVWTDIEQRLAAPPPRLRPRRRPVPLLLGLVALLAGLAGWLLPRGGAGPATAPMANGAPGRRGRRGWTLLRSKRGRNRQY